ncbi:MAG: tRNA lysidine(34) synthetase TilS [Lachnospiraceae bacterium]|jgi:tRNA(Ile)-lysidine synthetase-like protein
MIDAGGDGGFVAKVERFSQAENLFAPGDSLIAGVSGGADSTALLLFFCALRQKYRLRITAVHVHHGIRGAEADADESAVKELCAENSVKLFCFSRDIPREAKEKGLSEEEAGRRARYEIFEEVRARENAALIATAHHMDDQAESVLMNLIRGTGIRGMAGMLPKNGRVIHPFLCVRRAEIEEWLTGQGISWRTDATNGDDSYTRNAVRHRILPELEKIRPRAVEHIASAAQDFRQADALLRAEADRKIGLPPETEQGGGLRQEIAQKIGLPQETERGGGSHPEAVQSGGFPLRAGQETDLPRRDGLEDRPRRISDPERVLREQIRSLLEPCSVFVPPSALSGTELESAYAVTEGLRGLGAPLRDLSRERIREILRLAANGPAAGTRLPGGISVYREYGGLRLVADCRPKVPDRELFSLKLSLPAVPEPPDFSGNQSAPAADAVFPDSCIAMLNYGKIANTVCLRFRRQSDRFCVNRDGSAKKLKDVMIDLRIPARLRDRWPLLASGDNILWIPGCRLSPYFFITRETRTVLTAELRLLPQGKDKDE